MVKVWLSSVRLCLEPAVDDNSLQLTMYSTASSSSSLRSMMPDSASLNVLLHAPSKKPDLEQMSAL
jgi:hypothetical protein